MGKTYIYASIIFEGVHWWPQAPDKMMILRAPHRHLFHVKGYKLVTHDDRDVEFIMLGHDIKTAIYNIYPGDICGAVNLETSSCEQIADTLIQALDLVACEVSEDGENGAIKLQEGIFLPH